MTEQADQQSVDMLKSLSKRIGDQIDQNLIVLNELKDLSAVSDRQLNRLREWRELKSFIDGRINKSKADFWSETFKKQQQQNMYRRSV